VGRRLGYGLLVMLLALALGVWTSRRGGETTTTTQSIAVLPLLDLSTERDQEYFADGLTEELLNVLARNPRLRVAGRTSTFQFKDTRDDPRAIGRRLSVSSVLEGSVRRSADRVRISVQLVSTADGFHLWAETYDREMHDIIAVQEEIARSVADALKVTLLGERGPSVTADANVPGYTAYLQGKYFLQLNTKESLEKAVRYFGEAIALDPTSAPAWSGLAIAHVTSATEGHEPPATAYAAARAAVERARAIDANLAHAYVALSTIRRVYDWDWAGADAAAQRALQLAPNSGDVILNAARAASAVGRLDEAFHLTQRAAALDPLNVAVFYRQGRYAYFLGQFDDATTALTRALELNPGYRGAPSTLALVAVARSHPDAGLAWLEKETQDLWRLQALAILQHAAGRPAEADAALAQLVTGYGDVAACQIAEVYGYRGDVDRAFEWLERAYRQRDGGLSQLKGNPHLRGLESDPRYANFLRKMQLPL
jgi:TolB-like protein